MKVSRLISAVFAIVALGFASLSFSADKSNNDMNSSGASSSSSNSNGSGGGY
ncbi:hypothetical protein SAMN06265784_107251 [Paraburkholderia susongensis]|uniref:Uncharacterized protein n=1 Tax=Paraburkholderia susongensis TaxID=1515439 RepID=A0A1X7LQ94_9BURK|nr:hypothetical protein SAMN06265784_107251 [Paraburkholderia susongensis]